MQTNVGSAADPRTLTASYIYVARYVYSDTVLHNDNQFRIFPREGEGQSALHSQLWTLPSGRGVTFQDRFGNPVQRCRVIEHHTSFVVATAGLVGLATEPPVVEDVALDDVRQLPEAFEYAAWSPLVDPESVAELTLGIADDTDSLLGSVTRVLDWVFREVRYIRGSTDVATTAARVAEVREGVCQDKSHLALGMLRSLGIPCRYMSGLLTEQTGETHSWLEFLHPQAGWLGADPTRGVMLPPARDYVKLAVGRDYTDVSPVSGSFLSKGGAEECAAIAAVQFSQRESTLEDALALLENAYIVKNTYGLP